MRWCFTAWALAVLLLCTSGCGGQKSPPSADFDQARAALTAALDAWKADQPSDSLQSLSPPLFVNDTDWQAGNRLQAYEILGGMDYHGVQARCAVKLTLIDKAGASSDKKVNYLIDTAPALVIVRGDPPA